MEAPDTDTAAVFHDDSAELLAARRTEERSARLIRAVVGVSVLVVACVVVAYAARGGDDTSASAPRHSVVLVSIDGFRADYMDTYRARMPALARLAGSGARAERMAPVFPSKTFPNHYSLVTGLFPAWHGIVANTFWVNGNSSDKFRISDSNAVRSSRFWLGEPIWVTARKQGHDSACYFWPGSEAEIDGYYPTTYMKYDGSIPNKNRSETVLEWLSAANRPSIVTLYFSAVDSAGHSHGPNSSQVADAIEDVDSAIGVLLDGLDHRGLSEYVSIVVVSDHGMTEISPSQTVYLSDHVDLTGKASISTYSPILGLYPQGNETAESIYALVHNIHPNISVFLTTRNSTEDPRGVPSRWAYYSTVSDRIPPVIAVADDGWSIAQDRSVPSWYLTGGTHGYDNELDSMQALFIASGPKFRNGAVIDQISNLDVYNLLCAAIGLQPAPNNGTDALINQILR